MSKELWEECKMCGEYWCNLHEEHAHDCDCPDIDAFAEMDIWPYEPGSLEKYSRLVLG